MSKSPSPVRREAMTRGIIKRRIHQNARKRFRCESRGRKDARPRQDIEIDDLHPFAQSIDLRILPREPSKAFIDFDQGERETLDTACQCQTRRAYPCPELDGVFARARRACCREQNCVMTEAVSLSQLTQTQTTSEHGVIGYVDCFAFVRLNGSLAA
jgi:hypothetical protein